MLKLKWLLWLRLQLFRDVFEGVQAVDEVVAAVVVVICVWVVCVALNCERGAEDA